VAKAPDGFISLKSLKQPSTDPAEAIAQIRRIYFKTTKQTIDSDLAHAIELLKSLETEEQREKAAVFMDGISQMRSEWARRSENRDKGPTGKPSSKQTGAKKEGAKSPRDRQK
jgi:hypothetical protein